MACSQLHLAACTVLVLAGRIAALTMKLHDSEALSCYSFAQFVRDFGRDYTSGTEEFEHRASLFKSSLAAVQKQNAKQGSWTAGVGKFMDWTPEEFSMLQGYKPSRAGKRASHAFLETGGARLRGRTQMNSTHHGGMSKRDGPAIRDQGMCGSCWAISAAEALEAQLIRAGAPQSVSAQALVDCVENPQHCGGSGGCQGATGELAYSYVVEHGIPTESEFPYRGRSHHCPSSLVSSQARIRISGFEVLTPNNQAAPLAEALTEKGPVVVSVDGSPWQTYANGVFDGCDKDAILSHAVLAKGFGIEDGRKYWLIQNSWGADWGESGHIRLLRHDDNDAWCGTDTKPQEGSGCDGGPPEITVCGMCGILYESVVPSGVYLEGSEDAFDSP